MEKEKEEEEEQGSIFSSPWLNIAENPDDRRVSQLADHVLVFDEEYRATPGRITRGYAPRSLFSDDIDDNEEDDDGNAAYDVSLLMEDALVSPIRRRPRESLPLPPAFEIYVSPAKGGEEESDVDPLNLGFGEESSILLDDTHPTVAARAFSTIQDTLDAARHFQLHMYSMEQDRSKGRLRVTRMIISSGARVHLTDDNTRCKVVFDRQFSESFVRTNENLDPAIANVRRTKGLPDPLGVVTLDEHLIPRERMLRRDTDLPSVNPLFLASKRKAGVVVIMPGETDAFTKLDHFVIELHLSNVRRLVRLAIHKHVFLDLAFKYSTQIVLNDIVVAPQITIPSLTLYAHHRRREFRRIGKKGKDVKLYVIIDRVECVLPVAFELLNRPPTPQKKMQRRDEEEEEQGGGTPPQTPMTRIASSAESGGGLPLFPSML